MQDTDVLADHAMQLRQLSFTVAFCSLPCNGKCLSSELLLQELTCWVFCRGQDFEKAGSLRDKEMELKAQISKITNEAKESEQAEVESGDNTGPMVTEADIANIVAQWTGMHLMLCISI